MPPEPLQQGRSLREVVAEALHSPMGWCNAKTEAMFKEQSRYTRDRDADRVLAAINDAVTSDPALLEELGPFVRYGSVLRGDNEWVYFEQDLPPAPDARPVFVFAPREEERP